MSGEVHGSFAPEKPDAKKPVPKRTVKLKNREGRALTMILREYKLGDEDGMIACIRDEYKETYFKRELYRPEYIRKAAKSRCMTFLVAQTRVGEIAGMLILKQFDSEEAICELASQIFRKKYRGYGLAMPFWRYAMEILLSRPCSAAYCLPVVFHDVTQRLLCRLGMCACGFVLNVFDMEKISHSYHNGRNTKHSQGIQVRMAGKKNAGIIYVPQEHAAFCYRIYDRLGAAYQPATGEREMAELLTAASEVSYNMDKTQKNLEMTIQKIGTDLPKRIRKLHEKYPLTGRQTANIFLNCCDRHAPWAYGELVKMGYFFTGVKPLCGGNEYIVLHHPGEVDIYFEDYVVSEEFAPLLSYVNRCYKKRLRLLGGPDGRFEDELENEKEEKEKHPT